VTCGNGTWTRERNCTEPEPRFGGLNCTGNGTETDTCVMYPCPGESRLIAK